MFAIVAGTVAFLLLVIAVAALVYRADGKALTTHVDAMLSEVPAFTRQTGTAFVPSAFGAAEEAVKAAKRAAANA